MNEEASMILNQTPIVSIKNVSRHHAKGVYLSQVNHVRIDVE